MWLSINKLYQHQQDIINKDPKRCGLFLGTGSGKTRITLSLAKGSVLVICPKTQFLDGNWQRESIKIGQNPNELKVLSKEQFKKVHKTLKKYDTVIVDEAHTVCGVSPDTKSRKGVEMPKASQLYEAVQWYVTNHEPERIYLVTATPTRTPMAVWAASKLLLRGCDFYKFRSQFYVPKKINGYVRFLIKKDKASKALLGELVRKIGFTGKLDDWFDVPEQTERVISCPLTKEQENVLKTLHVDFPDPLVLLGKSHQVENGVLMTDEYTDVAFFNNKKLEAITDLLEEFPKVIVFAKYINQIEQIKLAAEKLNIKVYVLTGRTKNREEVIAGAEGSSACLFIAQSSISSGYELPSFRCTIFASASYIHLDLEQARGRNLRANKLEEAKNLYVYLESGKVDKAVWSALQNKQDFHEAIFINNN